MGYNTDYTIEAGPFDDEVQAEFFEFKMEKQSGYSIDSNVSVDGSGKYRLHATLSDVKWYSWNADMTELSRDFPYVTIDVEGDGEESGDQWKARFFNGDCEKVEAIVTFPEFQRLR